MARIRAGVTGKESEGYAASLSNLALCHSALGDYETAVSQNTDAIAIRKRVLGTGHPDYAESLNNLANCLVVLGHHEEAVALYNESLTIAENALGQDSPKYAEYLFNLSTCYTVLGQYGEAIAYQKKAISILESAGGADHPDCASFYDALALSCLGSGDIESAYSSVAKALAIREKALGKEHPDNAPSLAVLATYYNLVGNYEKAVECYSEALRISEKNFGEGNFQSTTYLIGLAGCQVVLAHYDEAAALLEKAIPITEASLGKENESYASCLYTLAMCHDKLGQYETASHLYERTFSILEGLYGKSHQLCIESLVGQAGCYVSMGDYPRALSMYDTILGICKSAAGVNSIVYANVLTNYAICHEQADNYEKALSLFTEAQGLLEASTGKENVLYAGVLEGMANCHSQLGAYEKAYSCYQAALSIRRVILGSGHPDVAQTLCNLATLYATLDDYEEASRLFQEAIGIIDESLGKDHSSYATLLNNLADCYEEMLELEKSLSLRREAVRVYERAVGDKHPDYASALASLAVFYSKCGYLDEALALLRKAAGIFENTLGTNYGEYARVLFDMAVCYCYNGNYEEALPLLKKSAEVRAAIYGEGVADRSILMLLSLVSEAIDDPRGVMDYSTQALGEVTRDIVSRFGFLTSLERGLYLEQQRWWFDQTGHFAFKFPSDGLASNGYNGTLFCKGLLLNTEREFKSLVEESGDEIAIGMFEELRIKRLQIDRLRKEPVSERSMNLDSLETVAQELERRLISRSKVFGDFTKNLLIDWKQVQSKLKAGEAAVEFVSFESGRDSLLYAAYVLKPGLPAPKMIPLFESKQLTGIPTDDYYTTPAVSELVWGPLSDDLSDVGTVYFAPSGRLYSIAIESLPDWSPRGGLLSDSKDYHRLSSTRELAIDKTHRDWKSAVVYGGLVYEMGEDELIEDSNKYQSIDYLKVPRLRGIASSIDLRSGAEYLPGTLEEAMSICSTLEDASVHTKAYLDTSGTEASFKSLTGTGVDVLHVATHSFFDSEEEDRHSQNSLYFSFLDKNTEDHSLERSGLILSGANYALKGNSLPAGVDDGILTAKELAKMDLRGLDLVVLSACQTGLGEITGEGVFGLQRGFKKAGADAVLMSLWKVDDDATRLLMSRFFSRLSEGASKHDALLDAQKYVREYEKEVPEDPQADMPFQTVQNMQAHDDGDFSVKQIIRPYESPYYWAAFVLLDGIR